MITPQQIDQIAFGTAKFGGYNKADVDEFLEPLTEDYITLYKENALLKSKMKVLVSKLEEYRSNEASMRDAIVNSQKACDNMIKETEAKCAKMLNEANATAARNAQNADEIVVAETARVEEAKRTAAAKIDELSEQLRSCLQALERIKEANAPAEPSAAPAAAYDYEQDEAKSSEPADSTDAVADEISASLQALVGSTEEPAPKAPAQHPVKESTTSKFANLKFGPNYDPTEHK